jgi:uncharacterized protein (TIGR02246 family)
MGAGVEDKLRQLEAYEQIRRLVAEYALGFDRRDRERFASVWHEDASWQPMPGGDWVTGREAIVGAAAPVWDAVQETHHWMANHSIQVDGDSASAEVDADVVMQTADGNWFRIAAAYHDEYERRGDTWAILRRSSEVFHHVAIAEPTATG